MRTVIPNSKYRICSLTAQATRRMIAFYNRELEPLGLTAPQVMALSVFVEGEDIPLGEFARRAGMGKAAGVTMIKRLEDQGLVETQPDPSDGRLNLIRITDKALALAPRISAVIERLEKTLLEAVGGEELEILLNGLKKIRDLDI
ncbi:MAG: MarR family transcriptional regulator [Pseudomonadota bacterium]